MHVLCGQKWKSISFRLNYNWNFQQLTRYRTEPKYPGFFPIRFTAYCQLTIWYFSNACFHDNTPFIANFQWSHVITQWWAAIKLYRPTVYLPSSATCINRVCQHTNWQRMFSDIIQHVPVQVHGDRIFCLSAIIKWRWKKLGVSFLSYNFYWHDQINQRFF